MINAKTHRARCEIRKISDNGHHFVPAWTPQDKIVRRVMNDDVIGMIGERADAKSDNQTQPPVMKSQRTHCVRNRRMQDHDRDSNQRSPRIAHHQLANFRMRLNDRPSPSGMRLIRFRLVERLLHRPSNYASQPRPQTPFFKSLRQAAASPKRDSPTFADKSSSLARSALVSTRRP